MAENEAARRAGNASQSGGFVVRPATGGRQANRGASEEFDVGGFVVRDSADDAAHSRAESGAASVSVEQPLPRSRRCSLCGQIGHTARNCSSDNVARTAPKAPSGQAISVTAPLLVGTLNLFVIESMGENCGITEKEAQFLIPSTQRTLERMPKGAAERLAVVIDPTIIVAVMGMWLKRIADTKRAEALQKYVVDPREQARANGVSGTEYRVQTSAGQVYTGDWHDTQHTFQPNPSHPAHCIVCALPYDNLNSQGAPLHYPMQADAPMPEHPDVTSNGVPSAIRESFNSGGDAFNSAI